MELKPLKKGEVAVTVTYRITDKLINEKIPFLRANSRLKASEGIPAIYIDDQGRKKPTSTINFSEPGEHIVRIVLEDCTVIPQDFLSGAKHIYSVDIPDTVTTIEEFAFRWTHMACPPSLPPNLKTIGRCAFDGAYNDVDCLQLPDAVEIVGDEAFNGIKHLIVGKNYQGPATYLQDYEKVTIPDDNIYLEVRDGFIVNRETKEVMGMLPGAYEDSEDVTIRLPEETTAFYKELFKQFEKASIYIPGSVEKCEMSLSSSWSEPMKRTIELAEGIKEIKIYGNKAEVNLSIPSSATEVKIFELKAEHLSIPAGCLLTDSRCCNIARLELGADVTLKGDKFLPQVFSNFEGEIFVEGPIHFEEWGPMKNESVIHVPNEETGRKIFNSRDFNKKVKIFIGADKLLSDQEEGADDKRIFRLLGCPNYNKVLKPIDAQNWMPKLVTLLYNVPAKTTVEIKTNAYEYMLDDGDAKKFRGKITLPKGLHIIRLLGINYLDHEPLYSWDESKAPVFEPACDAMLIDDNMELNKISRHIKGVKHLILGARCNASEFRLPVERISVVPENQWLEEMNGCIVSRETKELLFLSVDAMNLPAGIEKINKCALKNFCQERLVIPGSTKEVSLDSNGMDNIKELVFEEGVEIVSLHCINLNPDMKISFPSTMKRLDMEQVTVPSVTVPNSCDLGCFSNSHIDKLEFLGDVALRPSFSKTFDDFSGNIHFHGNVSLYQESVSGKDNPATFFGKTNDDCTITVSSQKTADAIKQCVDYNPKTKIIIG